MITFKQYLNEAIVSFGNNPKGQVVILAGGAGSGKGFILQYGIDIDGKHIDTDEIKSLALRWPQLQDAVKEKTGIDIQKLDLRNPSNTEQLHDIMKKMGWYDDRLLNLMASIAAGNPENRPNLIFDVTLQNFSKLETLCDDVKSVGYSPRNINIVWVLDSVKMSIQKNLSRDRVVPTDILVKTHEGASQTMREVLDDYDRVKQYADGYYYIVFNAVGIDNNVYHDSTKGIFVDVKGRLLIKTPGNGIDQSKLTKEVVEKIKSYVPNPDIWKDTQT